MTAVTTTAPESVTAPEPITAAQVREGDLVQHRRKFWPAQTVTAVIERYGRLTFELSGGSRVSGVSPSAPFLRYPAKEAPAPAPAAFVFDGDYDNLGQIAPFYPAYTARRAELDAANQYPYNDLFKGHLGIPSGKAEDTAIYLCQTLAHIHEDALRVNEFIDAGGWFLTPELRVLGRVDVAMFGWYSGGTGFRIHADVRLVYREGADLPYMVLPKGKRTNGYALEGVVLAKPAA